MSDLYDTWFAGAAEARRLRALERAEDSAYADQHPVLRAVDDAFPDDDTPWFARFPVRRRGPRDPLPWLLRQAVLRRDHFTCLHCGQQRGRLEVDHIVPWSAGGEDRSTNLRTLCRPCNQRRSNFRYMEDPRPIPAALMCDCCYGAAGDDRAVRAFCGVCGAISTVTAASRLL
jgi:hypothetical protein